MFPVVGLATMVSTAIFCIAFTMYLKYKRTTINHITISQLLREKLIPGFILKRWDTYNIKIEE